jgi:hypothetical protein
VEVGLGVGVAAGDQSPSNSGKKQGKGAKDVRRKEDLNPKKNQKQDEAEDDGLVGAEDKKDAAKVKENADDEQENEDEDEDESGASFNNVVVDQDGFVGGDANDKDGPNAPKAENSKKVGSLLSKQLLQKEKVSSGKHDINNKKSNNNKDKPSEEKKPENAEDARENENAANVAPPAIQPPPKFSLANVELEIDLIQTNFLDYLNGELGKAKDRYGFYYIFNFHLFYSFR